MTNATQTLRLVFFSTILFASCAHRKSTEMVQRDGDLFPDGIHSHWISVVRPDRRLEFRGILSKDSDTLKLAGLWHGALTLFTLIENRATGEIKIDFALDSMKKSTEQVRSVYASIRTLFLLPVRPRDGQGISELTWNSHHYPATLVTMVEGRTLRVSFLQYTMDAIPESIEIRDGETLITIRLEHYEKR